MNPEPRKPGVYELPRGTVVGKYEILRKIATGGMAEIYLARITGAAGFEKLVVLKRILPAVAEDPSFVQMFLDEARLAATLRHPNIADVYDVGESDETFFFTMEYVHGQDVRAIRHEARKRNESVPVAIALAVIHGAASALDHAHEKVGADGKLLGLVHRDVSASNLMVSYDGAVKLLDFGIARASSSSHKTQTGTLKGKVPYMSPEQCRGLPLDRRSDLFSLGVVMYELTVGRRPFRGETDFAIMDQIVYQGAQPPSQLVQGYPPELEAIVMKLLERGPSQRYPTGEDMLHELDEFIAKHGLWLSSRAIGKYMRELFAEKIEAWEHAQQEGVPFATHVAHTITSQSQRSELFTPPHEFAGLPPRTTSERMMAAAPPAGSLSQPMAVFQPIAPVQRSSMMQAVADEPPSRVSYPALPKRSLRGVWFGLIGALILAAGGAAGFMLSRRDAPAAAQPMVGGGKVEMIKMGDSPAPPAAEHAEASKPPEPEQPKPPTFEPTVTEPTVSTVRAPAPSKQKSKPAPVVRTKPRKQAKQEPAKQEPAKQEPKAEEPKPTPKEDKTWDPNSPTLPQ